MIVQAGTGTVELTVAYASIIIITKSQPQTYIEPQHDAVVYHGTLLQAEHSTVQLWRARLHQCTRGTSTYL